jgi:UDP-glucose 4-epimerase
MQYKSVSTSSPILVTGGAGFIGSHIVDSLIEQGYRVLILDNLSMGKREHIHPEAIFIEGDIRDPDMLARVFTYPIQNVFHLAARVTIRGSVEQYYEDADTNFMGSLRLYEFCKRHQVQKIIFASSMAVYPDSPDKRPAEESDILQPLAPYGISKQAMEQFLRMMASETKITPVIFRYFNTFGPRQALTPYVGVITLFLDHLRKGKSPTIFGDGNQTRDFIHVRDVAAATILGLHPAADHQIFNVGTGIGTTINDLFAILQRLLKQDLLATYAPPRREEHRYSVGSIAHIQSQLGFQPRISLEQGLKELITQQHQDDD